MAGYDPAALGYLQQAIPDLGRWLAGRRQAAGMTNPSGRGYAPETARMGETGEMPDYGRSALNTESMSVNRPEMYQGAGGGQTMSGYASGGAPASTSAPRAAGGGGMKALGGVGGIANAVLSAYGIARSGGPGKMREAIAEEQGVHPHDLPAPPSELSRTRQIGRQVGTYALNAIPFVGPIASQVVGAYSGARTGQKTAEYQQKLLDAAYGKGTASDIGIKSTYVPQQNIFQHQAESDLGGKIPHMLDVAVAKQARKTPALKAVLPGESFVGEKILGGKSKQQEKQDERERENKEALGIYNARQRTKQMLEQQSEADAANQGPSPDEQALMALMNHPQGQEIIQMLLGGMA